MMAREYTRYLSPTLSSAEFTLVEIDDSVKYRGSDAWAAYYRGVDCKLQMGWASREGGTYFMLAPLDAPNELGLINASKKWHWMLMLSDVDDDLITPPVGSSDSSVLAWLKDLFDVHYAAAHTAIKRIYRKSRPGSGVA